MRPAGYPANGETMKNHIISVPCLLKSIAQQMTAICVLGTQRLTGKHRMSSTMQLPELQHAAYAEAGRTSLMKKEILFRQTGPLLKWYVLSFMTKGRNGEVLAF